LYFITRALKTGIKKTSKIPDKYIYKCWSIETDFDIQNELYNVFVNKLAHISNEDKYSVTDYTLITDDAEKKIMTYSKKEKISSFMHIVDNDLINISELDPVINLEKIASSIWAYIIEIYIDEKIICGLRKMAPSKVLTGDKGILTVFKTKDKSLRLSKDQTITFDKNIDVLYFNDTFFIVSKDNFEEIVGLEEEYREEARIVADKISNNNLISLNYNLLNEIEERNRFIRKLAKIKDEIDNLNADRIKRMRSVAKQFKQKFELDKNGKIIINDSNDLDIVVKLLDDYFLESPQTDKRYGASVKHEIN
jgi:hypothetical protein